MTQLKEIFEKRSFNNFLNDIDNPIIKNAISFVKKFFDGESSGHDYFHTIRVYKTALSLAKIEEKKSKLNLDIIALASLLHDVDDSKLSPETSKNKDNAVKFLRENGVSENTINQIVKIISQVSFMGKDSVTPDSLEGKIVQDADRLDGIGAIGIGRTFAYGGSKGRTMFDPDIIPNLDMDKESYKNSNSTTINHFYEKLLILKDLMNTDTGKQIAEHRTNYMKNFLDEFYDEWDGKI